MTHLILRSGRHGRVSKDARSLGKHSVCHPTDSRNTLAVARVTDPVSLRLCASAY